MYARKKSKIITIRKKVSYVILYVPEKEKIIKIYKKLKYDKGKSFIEFNKALIK